MNKIFLFSSFVLFFGPVSYTQDSIAPAKNWKLKSIQSLSTSQSSFVNWNAGGRTSLNLLGSIIASANYVKDKWTWNNDLTLALGGNKFFDTGDHKSFQKTDDKIDFTSEIEYELHKHWSVAFLTGFRTQFAEGYTNQNDTLRSSLFMAPGYLNLALGIEYVPTPIFSMFLSPASVKMTFVQDGNLSNAGAFGVRKAELDTLGNVLRAGDKFRGEIGAYLRFKLETPLGKNVDLKSKLEFFSNYQHNPQNIDVNGELLMNFKVNNWLNASLAWNYIYDDDIQIQDYKGNIGPRSQFKSVISIGLAYTVKNFKE